MDLIFLRSSVCTARKCIFFHLLSFFLQFFVTYFFFINWICLRIGVYVLWPEDTGIDIITPDTIMIGCRRSRVLKVNPSDWLSLCHGSAGVVGSNLLYTLNSFYQSHYIVLYDSSLVVLLSISSSKYGILLNALQTYVHH